MCRGHAYRLNFARYARYDVCMKDKRKSYDLRALSVQLTKAVEGISQIYLFGSRRYKTRSLRSDIDLLVVPNEKTHLKASDVREVAAALCPALDIFIVDGAKAVSVVNDSFVGADDLPALIGVLHAVLVWDKSGVVRDADVEWRVRLHESVTFVPTILPSRFFIAESFENRMRNAEENGLPTQPFLGDDAEDAATVLAGVIQRLIRKPDELAKNGDRQAGWTVHLRTEYDLQDLFFHTVKPWLPDLGREEVTIRYDGQDKLADFNLFKSQIVVEMKHVTDGDKKIKVVASLKGLADFYRQNANVRVLLFVVLVDHGVQLDDQRWVKDYSYLHQNPQVWTIVIRNNPKA